ncbi:hypothetical protein VD659_04615 [Herbiconiux sp. 11R-BC]|uniref:hypothetical protein n=1 Tax=Herbiconiux sp. 11R-BC TaxID=3111637 RepID=UPI003C01661D
MHHPPPARRRSRALTALVGVAAVAALSAGSLLLADSARAAFIDVPETGTAGRLVLSADPYPAEFLNISPGDPAYWQVDARLQDATRATLSLELRKNGGIATHPRGLTMTVDRCSVPWTDPTTNPSCSDGFARIVVATPADDDASSSPTFTLQPLVAGSPEHLLVTLAVEDSAAARSDDSLMGLTGNMGLGLTATAIDDQPITPVTPVPAGSGGGLAKTGLDTGLQNVLAFGALTAGLLGLVLVVARARGTRRDARSSEEN